MSTLHGGSHFGYVVHTHAHAHTYLSHPSHLSLVTPSLLLLFQDIVSGRDGVPDARPVRLGKHVLLYWFPVWTLGTCCLAVFFKRYSNYTS